jgi:hypothetical protein
MKGIRTRAGNTLITVGGLLLFGSAAAKLAHVTKVVAQMAALGFDGHKMTFVALLEVGSAVLFFVPITRSLGLLLVSSFMGGVIATHLQHDQSIAGPSIVLLALWLGMALRHREVLWSVQPSAGALQAISKEGR